jgi:hypothetical protein
MNQNQIKIFFLAGTVLLSYITDLVADDTKARTIMQRVDARDDGKSLMEDMHMVLIDKSGKQRHRTLRIYSKDFGPDTYQIMFFKAPADVKNTAFLTYDYKNTNKDDDQWLYLPALKKVKRIPSSSKSASFMGSDFSYFDSTSRNLNDYDFKLLKEIKVGSYPAWMIEVLPRSSKIVRRSGYTKTIAVVRKDNYMVVRSIGFLKNGKKKYFDIKRLHKQNGIWVADEVSMTTKKGKTKIHKTVLKFSNIKLNRPISNTMFTTRQLEKGL